MAGSPYDMARMTVTGTPGTGTITLNVASTPGQTFASANVPNQARVSIHITDGTDWEIAYGCLYTSSGTTLTRGTFVDSSTGSPLSLTSGAIVEIVTLSADLLNANVSMLLSLAYDQIAANCCRNVQDFEISLNCYLEIGSGGLLMIG